MKAQNYFWECFDFPEMTCQKCHGAGIILKKGYMYPVKCECLNPRGKGKDS
jgi:hypothetical protein